MPSIVPLKLFLLLPVREVKAQFRLFVHKPLILLAVDNGRPVCALTPAFAKLQFVVFIRFSDIYAILLWYCCRGKVLLDATMLLRFGVENHRSIREYQQMSLVASALKEHRESLIAAPGQRWGVLPVAAVYGANASGKSNFLDAIGFMKRVVLTSFSKGDASGGCPQVPFKLSREGADLPSRYDCDFVIEGIRYHYGFVLDTKRIREEWLFAFPRAAKTVLFHRDVSNQSQPYYFGRALKGRNKDLQQITRDNSLFLSAAVQGNHEQLRPIFEFFSRKLTLRLSPQYAHDVALAPELETEGQRDRLSKYLAMADTGICAIRTNSREIDPKQKRFMETVRAAIQEMTGEKVGEANDKNIELELGHKSQDGEVRYLSYGEESLGTKYLMTILGPLLRALEEGSVLILDEITTSLHTLLSQQLISMFTSKLTNSKDAQLVFSTHDTNLLTSDLLRRDEIWFAEKDRAGATTLFSLADIRTKNSDNFERGYIQGRYGAIPFITNLTEKVPDEEKVS